MDKKRVLVVDDEPEVTYALQAYFLGKGYEMLTALDGLQAMRYIRQQTIDLVLLDMKMPGVNGLEVLKFLHTQSASTKVVVVTAYDDQFQEMVERLGVDGFLMKPFGIEALTKTVEQALSGARPPVLVGAGEAAPMPPGPPPKAKLLFMEPSEYTYKLKEVFFSSPDQCRGIYQVAGAYSVQEALHQLREFQPDIALVDVTVLGPSGDAAVKMMASSSRPKELILHGFALPAAQNTHMEDLARRGVKVVYNESFTRAGLARLAEVVRKTALSKGLSSEVPTG